MDLATEINEHMASIKEKLNEVKQGKSDFKINPDDFKILLLASLIEEEQQDKL